MVQWVFGFVLVGYVLHNVHFHIHRTLTLKLVAQEAIPIMSLHYLSCYYKENLGMFVGTHVFFFFFFKIRQFHTTQCLIERNIEYTIRSQIIYNLHHLALRVIFPKPLNLTIQV